jgi:hypothetical protein
VSPVKRKSAMILLKTNLLTTTDLWFKEYFVASQLNGTTENV